MSQRKEEMEGLLVSLFGRLQESDGGKERKTSSLQNYLHQVIKSCLICLLYKKKLFGYTGVHADTA
jgi:hypothetical protein